MTNPVTSLDELTHELASRKDVRTAFFVRGDVPVAGDVETLGTQVAAELARTVRRMQLASTTVGAPFAAVCVSLAGARLYVRAMGEDGALVILLRRGAHLADVRRFLDARDRDLRVAWQRVTTDGAKVGAGTSDVDDEPQRLWDGPVGPVLARVKEVYASYVSAEAAGGRTVDDLFDEQLREWLMCCNPSAYTFPLLLDGLAQTLDDRPNLRAQFKAQVQEIGADPEPWEALTEASRRVG